MKLATKTVQEIDHIATGAMLRNARIKAGQSLTAVAKKLKLSISYLSDLERGRKNWNENLLRKFKAAL